MGCVYTRPARPSLASGACSASACSSRRKAVVVTLVVELGRVDEPVLQDGEWQQQQQDVRGGGGDDEEHEEEEQPAFGAEERGHAEERRSDRADLAGVVFGVGVEIDR